MPALSSKKFFIDVSARTEVDSDHDDLLLMNFVKQTIAANAITVFAFMLTAELLHIGILVRIDG
ncbi:MAG: hypothetical protein IJ668_11155 [Selenomonadaceae bacterium]|nr:hypothetical protein [Selenomonadaceae bacterium]